MNEFGELLDKTVASLREICDNLIKWENQNIFKNMESIVKQINQTFTIIFTNQNKLKIYNINVNENEIVTMLGNMLISMENKDVVLLLDTLECEIIVTLEEINNKIKM